MTETDDSGEPERPSGTWSRRGVLAATGGAGTALLAGCLGGGSPGSGDGGDDGAAGGGGGSGDDGTETTDETGGASGSPTADTGDNGPTDGGMGTGTVTSRSATATDDGTGTATSGGGDGDATATDGAMGSLPTWQTTELTPVRGGDSFAVAGFDGPVVVETFAVWCPVCTRQQRKLADLGGDVTVVSLNVDPNESASKVREHATEHGFDWRYAVAPTDVTRSLVEEFGSTVTNAPSAPVVVVCPDGESSLLTGVNSAASITSAVENC